ncbi:unnamed protein product [Gadus morhua 'NCC']
MQAAGGDGGGTGHTPGQRSLPDAPLSVWDGGRPPPGGSTWRPPPPPQRTPPLPSFRTQRTQITARRHKQTDTHNDKTRFCYQVVRIRFSQAYNSIQKCHII